MVSLAALAESLRHRISMMVGRGVLAALSAEGGLAKAQITGITDDDVLDGRDYLTDYGISSRPWPGAEALMLYLAGLRSNGMVVRLFDRRYTIALEYGEIALHDDLGQKVHLTRDGIIVSSPHKIRFEAPDIQIHATEVFRWDVAGHGQVWYPTKVDTWQIGEEAGTPHSISPPEVVP